MRSPVLFLIFNRPDTTQRVFNSIREAQPPRLYIVADGPRAHKPGEVDRCNEARRIATSVDWPCELKTLFREQNLGCKLSVSKGIDWFFDNEEEGLIIEDDVLPVSSFYPYCDELLERYRHDARVAFVSGSNNVASRYCSPDSYFFSYHILIWGWATWRRAWRNFDVTMKDWPKWRRDGGLRRMSQGKLFFERYWQDIFDRVYAGEVDTWDFQWNFACWKRGMVTAIPKYNQTFNLGFGADSTHTMATAPRFIRDSIPNPLDFPLQHPPKVEGNTPGDVTIDRLVYGISILSEARRVLRKTPWVGPILLKLRSEYYKHAGRFLR
jgi:hypothetical protein